MPAPRVGGCLPFARKQRPHKSTRRKSRLHYSIKARLLAWDVMWCGGQHGVVAGYWECVVRLWRRRPCLHPTTHTHERQLPAHRAHAHAHSHFIQPPPSPSLFARNRSVLFWPLTSPDSLPVISPGDRKLCVPLSHALKLEPYEELLPNHKAQQPLELLYIIHYHELLIIIMYLQRKIISAFL